MDNLKPPSGDLDGDTLYGQRVISWYRRKYRVIKVKKGPGKGRERKRRVITYVRLSY